MRKMLPWSLALVLTLALPFVADDAVAAKAAQAKPSAPVNLNTASQSDLEALPGVGPATAKRLLRDGPTHQSRTSPKRGFPKNTIDKIASMVTVGAAPGAQAPKPAPAATAAPASTPARATSTSATAQQPPVKGMVWVNLESKVFHREGDRFYGNTKKGKFMTEADAVKAGYREAKAAAKKAK